MSFKVHVIHDLDYGFNEPTDPEDLILPDVDLVIFNGNLSHHGKRSIFYAFELAKMYPNIQFVYNEGYIERYRLVVDKWENELEDSMKIRTTTSNDWPKNLHWKDPRSPNGLEILLQTGQTVSVWPCFGFPNVVSYDGAWEDTWFYCNICRGQIPVYKLDSDLLPGTELKIYGDLNDWATQDYIHSLFKKQEAMIRNWETQQIAYKHYGIIATHLNPYKDPRLEDITYSAFNIHLNERLWVTTHQEKSINFLGAKLYSNPGRGSGPRGKFIEVD